MEDMDVIRCVKNGDTETFSILVERYHRHLLNFIFRLVGDAGITEDIGQEVFLSVYKSLKDFDENRGTPFSAWLFITARNRCISELRKNKGGKTISWEDTGGFIVDKKTGENILIEKERQQAVQASLAQLPEPYKKTILMSLRGDSVDEIAEIDNVPVGTVKSRLSRAKGKIIIFVREYFGGKGYERI